VELLEKVKNCKDCKAQKPVGEFYAYKNESGLVRFRPRCKSCHNKKWRNPNKPRRVWVKDRKFKHCARCDSTKPRNAFHVSKEGWIKSKYCKQCHSAQVQERRLKDSWGLTQQDFDKLLAEQGGGCAICGSSKSGTRKDGRLCVDHNHETGQIRGLLCASCNRGIGLLGDSSKMLLTAYAYLKKWDC